MRDVQIKKVELLERLQTNRDNHHGVYEKALDAYQAKVTELLESLVQRARQGKVIPQDALYKLPLPEDHTEDYNVAIEMLQHEEREILTLSQQEFRRYFLDRWEWEQSFHANTQSYVG